MGARTNAVLTALNYYLNRKMQQEDEQRADRRKLEYLKNEYIQKQNLRNEYEKEAVEAERAKNLQIKNIADLTNNNMPMIEENYRLGLGNERDDSLLKSVDIQNRKELQPHQHEYNRIKIRKDIDDLLAAPEREAKERKMKDKLAALNIILMNKRIAGQDAKNDYTRARMGMLKNGLGVSAAGGKGGTGNYKFNDLMRTYVEFQRAMEEIRKDSQADGSNYLDIPGYKDLEDKALKLGKFIQYLYPEFNPQDPAAIKKVLDEAKDIGGAEGNIDKAIQKGEAGPTTLTSNAALSSAKENPKEAAVKAAVSKKYHMKPLDYDKGYGKLEQASDWLDDRMTDIDDYVAEYLTDVKNRLEERDKSGFYNKGGIMEWTLRQPKRLWDWLRYPRMFTK